MKILLALIGFGIAGIGVIELYKKLFSEDENNDLEDENNDLVEE